MKQALRNNFSTECYIGSSNKTPFERYVCKGDDKITFAYGAYGSKKGHSEDFWLTLPTIQPKQAQLEGEFDKLKTKWKKETGLFSTTADKINDTYLEIIALGSQVIPLILKDIQGGGSAHWHTALKVLSKENPIPGDDLTRSKTVKDEWLKWGIKNNLL